MVLPESRKYISTHPSERVRVHLSRQSVSKFQFCSKLEALADEKEKQIQEHFHVRVTHDDASSVKLGDLVGGERGLGVAEAEAALLAETPPVAVVVAVETGAASVVAHLKNVRNSASAMQPKT